MTPSVLCKQRRQFIWWKLYVFPRNFFMITGFQLQFFALTRDGPD